MKKPKREYTTLIFWYRIIVAILTAVTFIILRLPPETISTLTQMHFAIAWFLNLVICIVLSILL